MKRIVAVFAIFLAQMSFAQDSANGRFSLEFNGDKVAPFTGMFYFPSQYKPKGRILQFGIGGGSSTLPTTTLGKVAEAHMELGMLTSVQIVPSVSFDQTSQIGFEAVRFLDSGYGDFSLSGPGFASACFDAGFTFHDGRMRITPGVGVKLSDFSSKYLKKRFDEAGIEHPEKMLVHAFLKLGFSL